MKDDGNLFCSLQLLMTHGSELGAVKRSSADENPADETPNSGEDDTSNLPEGK
jgi:hypothetical protein